MKQRVLTGWTLGMPLYLIMGSIVIIQALKSGQWPVLALGAYLSSMGLFAFGCAVNCSVEPKQKNIKGTRDTEFEEVK